jgi:hypothetical protein
LIRARFNKNNMGTEFLNIGNDVIIIPTDDYRLKIAIIPIRESPDLTNNSLGFIVQ